MRKIPLDGTPAGVERRVQRYGDFSKMNNRWYASDSTNTHDRLANNPEELAHYHTLYRRNCPNHRRRRRGTAALRGSGRRDVRGTVRRSPAVRQQLDDAARRVIVDAGEHVGEVVDGIMAVLLTGVDERVEHGVVVARSLVAEKEKIGAAHRAADVEPLGGAVVDRNHSIGEESTERDVVIQHVANRRAELR
jgi:hypothetical protein